MNFWKRLFGRKESLNTDTDTAPSQTPQPVASTDSFLDLLLATSSDESKWEAITSMVKEDSDLGGRALHWAVWKGKKDVVERLLACGVDANADEDDGTTPLDKAKEWGHEDIYGLLLKKGGEPGVSSRGYTPLDYELLRAVRGHVGNTRALLGVGANPNVCVRCADGEDPVITWAVCSSDDWLTSNKKEQVKESLEIIELLLKAGAEIDAPARGGITALMKAILNRRVETVELLIERGASASVRDAKGRTAIQLSIEEAAAGKTGHEEIVRILTKRTREGQTWAQSREGQATLRSYEKCPTAPLGVSAVQAWDVFQNAMREGAAEEKALVKWVNSGGDVNWSCAKGMTLLHYAAMMQNDRMARLLLNHGANVNAPDKWNMTPLLHACKNRSYSVIPTLLDHGADANAQADGGYTGVGFLRQFFENEARKMEELLTQRGARTTPGKDATCAECGAPETEQMGKRGVRGKLAGGKFVVVAQFHCPGCQVLQQIRLDLIDKAKGLRVKCPSCAAISFVPPSAWCSACGKGLSTGWQASVRLN